MRRRWSDPLLLLAAVPLVWLVQTVAGWWGYRLLRVRIGPYVITRRPHEQ